MSGDILSIRVLVVSASNEDLDLLRQGAALAALPLELFEADAAGKAGGYLDRGDIDLVFLDSSLQAPERARVIKAARDAKNQPLIVQFAAGDASDTASAADALAPRPRSITQAGVFLDRVSRARVPCHVLVVDDSSTMRSIVKKILSASRFPLSVADASDGTRGLAQVRNGGIDVVLLDYNMPGLNGLATLAELKRSSPKVDVIIMTSIPDQAIADRALRAGASAFLRKPFFPADVDAVLYARYGLTPCARPAQ
jgi:CheY-like chemotaxis protein